jgi:glucose/arabinose dehydrogenase
LQFNHGLAVSSDGKTIYASAPDSVWSWSYDSSTRTSSNQQTIITNMETNDHTTRTLLLSRSVPGMLLVSRGSTSNIDIDAASLASGHSQIRAFNLNNRSTTAYDFDTTGLRLGWGLRNSVGIAEHPITGGIYSVENSADQIIRDGVDIHQNNPGEEMNFHGYLNGTDYAPQGGNYGYPWCFAAWDVDELPDHANLSVGSQFALSESNYPDNENRTDTYCAAQNAPRLTFQAHMAPLDIKFNNSGTQGWVTWHGSWDRTDPVGYKVSVIEFANGEPVAPTTSKTALTDIFTNADLSVCPNNCFRPVGMAFDGQGRLFVSSDATGEIYMITSEKVPLVTSSSSGAASSATATSTSTGSQASSTSNGRSLVADIVKSLQVSAIIACLAAAFVMA